MGDRNIAFLVKNQSLMHPAPFMTFGRYERLPAEVLAEIDMQYGPANRKLDTKKGEWRIHDKSLRDFAAVRYNENDIAHTLFCGATSNPKSIDSIAKILSADILEQRNWLSWPPGAFSQYDGMLPGVLAIYSLMGVDAATHVAIEAVTKRDLFSPTIRYIDALMQNPGTQAGINWWFVVFFTTTVILGVSAGKVFGEWADNYRVRHLPQEAHSWMYGPEAINYILKRNA